MENPASWGPVERIIDEALGQWDEDRAKGMVGFSRPAAIAERLRRAGLIDPVVEAAPRFTHFDSLPGDTDSEKFRNALTATESGARADGTAWKERGDGG